MMLPSFIITLQHRESIMLLSNYSRTNKHVGISQLRRKMLLMATRQQQFSAEVEDDFVHLKTWGTPDLTALEAPVNAALALAQEKHLEKLLDDIHDIDTSGVSMEMQAKAMGILWKLRSFRKIAFVLQGNRLQTLFFSTLEVLHLNMDAKFKGFENEADAIAWLKEN